MSNFVGSYVNDLTAVLVASALSRQNAIVLGAAGWGKTAISRSLAGQLTAGDYSFIRVDPSTPPDVVKGAYNPAALLDGRLERVTDGTPYDPRMKAAIVDEIGRANEAMFDSLLDTLDRVDNPAAPPVWATSNFMPSNERVAALIDRFGLWCWLQPPALDVAAVATAHLNGAGSPQVNTAGLPTWAQIEEVRAAVPGAKAIKAVTDLLADLSNEAGQNGRKAHPRRVAQWTQLVYRVGVWAAGSADFASVPDTAAKILRYAWPAVTPDEAATWAKIAGSVVDTLGAAIENALVQVVGEMKKIATEKDPSKRVSMVMNVGVVMQSTQATLESLAGRDNEKVQAAVTQMNEWLSRAIRGEEIQ